MLECHFGSSRIETTHQAHQKYYLNTSWSPWSNLDMATSRCCLEMEGWLLCLSALALPSPQENPTIGIHWELMVCRTRAQTVQPRQEWQYIIMWYASPASYQTTHPSWNTMHGAVGPSQILESTANGVACPHPSDSSCRRNIGNSAPICQNLPLISFPCPGHNFPVGTICSKGNFGSENMKDISQFTLEQDCCHHRTKDDPR